ncbi:MAG: CHAD domain-containing protein [Chlorobiales bacterium]|nr:CHAD domain-containing protein [Chlorobiales bacterium]
MRTIPGPLFFRLSDALDLPVFFKGMEKSFTFQAQPVRKETLDWFDTFDWKAWSRKSAIVRSGSRLAILDMKSGHELCGAPVRKRPRSFFPNDIDDKKTASRLLGISKLRAFILYGSVETETRKWRILDENRKTVASIELLSLPGKKDGKRQLFMKLSPVRGYGKELETVAGHLKQYPDHSEKITCLDYHKEILTAAGITPASYSSKPSVKLKPGDTIQDSARKLLLPTLGVLYANEKWISKNIDTEFLHDYRVAVRRTRSILAQLKGIFPPEELSRYKKVFRELGKRTGNLRDLDVYLLQADRFRNLLPGTMRDSLDTFFTDLGNRHKKELKSLNRYLGSEKHTRLMREWEAFLRSEMPSDPDITPKAGTKTSDVAVSTIRKAWKKVIRHGREISGTATDTERHTMRIECKKLRYLLEFYASILPAKNLQTVVRQLKTLQDNLGTFVDLSVQQGYLNNYLSRLEPGADNISSAASIGGLVTALYHERENVRMNFHNTFDTFDTPETEALFNELLNKHR